MILSDKKGVQHIVGALSELGLKEVVICPGSRNAPLVISFNRHPGFHCTSIRDERSAGFFALGKALETKEPVALICTSGSAALNFAPAIVEAYYQRIPLIVLTADRPKEWVNQGDGQTINQNNIYQNYVNGYYELNGDARTENQLWDIERKISEGWNKANLSNCGPVHYNIPLQEPLYETDEIDTIPTRTFRHLVTQHILSETSLEDLKQQIFASEKVMILVGQNEKNQDLQNILAGFSNLANIAILTESTSNVHHSNFIENIDRCITNLSEDEARNLMPDLLITIGGAIVSKRIKSLLRKFKPKAHWNIHPFDATMDTYQSLTLSVPMNAVDFLEQLSTSLKSETENSNYRHNWLSLSKEKETQHQTFCSTAVYSDFKVFERIYQFIPSDISLHISNSSPIRYAQLFDNSNIAETWCNRGTSGIDGCTSTAVGTASAAPEKDFLLITGDVAFHYDINALWNEENLKNLKIIVLNNGGGNIFRIIDGPSKVVERSQFLETESQSDLKHLSEHFNWHYLSIHSETGLSPTLQTFFKKETRRTILEIFTDAAVNPEVLKEYWEMLK